MHQRIKAIAQERRRFGFRRLHVLLKRESYLMSHKKLLRLYREQLDQGHDDGAHGPNDRWSLDFVSDQLTDVRRFRILSDDCARECLALVADTSLSGTRVARELEPAGDGSAANRRWWSATTTASSLATPS
ncbi:transposase [Bradyrhizobium sp. 193]|nr:transposase [Bradyrhizobium sp. 193]